MSDFSAVAAVSLLFVMGTFLFFSLSNKTNDIGAQIFTGVVGGTPISTELRWFLLYSTWTPYGGGVVSCGIFLAFAQVQIANYAVDENAKLLAYMAAFLAALAATGMLILGTAAFLTYRSVLRQAEAD